MELKKQRVKALRRDIRMLNRLANEAAKKKDVFAFVGASKARDERHAMLLELLEGKKPATNSETFEEPRGIDWRVTYQNGPEEKEILTTLAWSGYIADADRAELVRVGTIFDREKFLQLHDEAVRLKKIADANDKEVVN